MEDVGCAQCRLKPSPEIFSDNAKVQQFKRAITHILKHPETTTDIHIYIIRTQINQIIRNFVDD